MSADVKAACPVCDGPVEMMCYRPLCSGRCYKILHKIGRYA